MKKIGCPKCKAKWYKDDKIEFHIQGEMEFTICHVKIQDLIFCPYCFFTPYGHKFDYPKSYEAKLDKVILQEDDIVIKTIVVEDEFGNYINMDVDDFKKLKISGFDPYSNGGSEGSAQDLRDDFPSAATMPG